MLIAINKRLRDEEGFTLIELMVVVLIIAILIAIAIPTFLGARRRAQDRQAQSNLRNALTAEKTFYADAQGYTTVVADLAEIESNLAWGVLDGGARGASVLAVGGGASADQGVVIVSVSRSGTVFCIADLAQNISPAFNGMDTAGTYFGLGAGDTTAATCPTAAGDWSNTTAGWQ